MRKRRGRLVLDRAAHLPPAVPDELVPTAAVLQQIGRTRDCASLRKTRPASCRDDQEMHSTGSTNVTTHHDHDYYLLLLV